MGGPVGNGSGGGVLTTPNGDAHTGAASAWAGHQSRSGMDRLLLDAVDQAVMATDLEGRITYWNRAAEELYGWTADEVLGVDVCTITPSDEAAAAAAEIMEQLRQGQPWSGEFELRRRDGTTFVAAVTDSPVLDDAGNVVGIIGVSHDLSEWRRLEEEQRAAEERYRLGFEQSSVGMAVVGLDGRILEVNEAFCRLAGRRAGDLVGRSPDDFADGHTGPLMRDTLPLLLQGMTLRAAEGRLDRPDGTTAWAVAEAGLVSRDGVPLHVFVQLHDITERKAAEDEVAAQREQLRQLLDDVVDVVGAAVELRDPYTAGHQQRVGEIAARIATELGLHRHEVRGIEVAASIHDIGKIAVPSEILSRPGRLSPTEYALVQEHPQSGHDIVARLDFPWPVATMILQHHERLDGSGYPSGLAGDEILYGARIIAVADVIEAVTSHRPYRPGLGLDVALGIVDDGAGTRYDAEVVAAAHQVFASAGTEVDDLIGSEPPVRPDTAPR